MINESPFFHSNHLNSSKTLIWSLAGYGDAGIEKMYVTGASLGGGLAVITGAQTEAYTGEDHLSDY